MKRTRADGERKLQKPYKRVAVVGGEFTVARLSDGQPLVHKRGSMADRAAKPSRRAVSPVIRCRTAVVLALILPERYYFLAGDRPVCWSIARSVL